MSCSGQAELFGSQSLVCLGMFFSLFAALFQSIFAFFLTKWLRKQDVALE